MITEDKVIIEGYVIKEICSKDGGFKVYSFVPTEEYRDKVKLNPQYGNMSISGILPTLVKETKYKFEVVEKDRYPYSYEVTRYYTDIEITSEYKEDFLKTIVTDLQFDNIKKAIEPSKLVDDIIDGKEIDTSNMRGIGDYTINKIKGKVIENFKLINLVGEYKEFGMSFEMIKRLYDLYPSEEMLKQKMDENPYDCLCRINRVAFKTADKFILRKYPYLINSDIRCNSCIGYLLRKNEEDGNTWISFNDLYRRFMDEAPECSSNFGKAIYSNKGLFFCNPINKRVSRMSTYLCEQEVANMLLEMNSRTNIYNIDYSRYVEVNGFPLSEEQKALNKSICENSVCILTGGGGTGKTFSTKALVQMLEDNNLKFALCSPTGRASRVLSENTEKNAKTIHRLLKIVENEDEDGESPQIDVDVLIIDEFSMVGIFLLRRVLRVLKPTAKIVFIGDYDQIPSVECGNIAHDLVESNVFETCRLTKVFRYDEGGLYYAAGCIKEGRKFLQNTKDRMITLGTKKDYVFINTLVGFKEYVKALFDKLILGGANIDDIMVLTYKKDGEEGVRSLNKMLQDSYNPRSKGCDELKFMSSTGKEEIVIRVGDKIMQTYNDNDRCIYNGDIGYVSSIETGKNEVVVKCDFYGTIVEYKESDFKREKVVLAYCMTIHKSQGSQAKYVILLTPKSHLFHLNRNLLYVGVSRTKYKCFHIGDVNTLNKAIAKSETKKRNSNLLEMLTGDV